MPEEIVDQFKAGNDYDSKVLKQVMGILTESVKITSVLSSNNKTKHLMEKKRLNFASPRFLSVVPEQDDSDAVSSFTILLKLKEFFFTYFNNYRGYQR